MNDRRLILVRHAQSEANVAGAVTSVPPGPDLTGFGHAQADELAGLLADQGVRAIRTSNTTRARATARPLAERLGLTPQETPDLLEISCGDLDGSDSPADLAEVLRVYESWFGATCDLTSKLPGGETYAEVERRMLGALPAPAEVPEGGAMVVVAHGGSLRVAVCGLLGPTSPAAAGYLDNAAYLTLRSGPDGWVAGEDAVALVAFE